MKPAPIVSTSSNQLSSASASAPPAATKSSQSSSASSASAAVPSDYVLDGFSTNFDLILIPFWTRFGLHFGSIFGTPSGGHFERKDKETQRFCIVWGAKKAYFRSSFLA